jgi:glycosyltransferase involved in cell wall biosynthesis
LLSDGKDSLIIEPKDIDEICDAIIKLKNDKAYYEMISRNGMEAVEMFTWEKLYCEKAEELFYELTK